MLKRALLNAGTAIASFGAALALAEAALRLVAPEERYTVLVPGSEWTVAESRDIRGVRGVSRYRVNAEGIRGRLSGPDSAEYRLLAVGGSTTQSANLDDDEAWTHLLETRLGRTTDGRVTWVGNVGASGLRAAHHVVQLDYLLRQPPRVQGIIMLLGVNDLAAALAQGWHYRPADDSTPEAKGRVLFKAFARAPAVSTEPRFKRTALWRLARRARQNWTAQRFIGHSSEGVRRARAHRAASPTVDSLPPLDQPLADYRHNLGAIADRAAAVGVRIVFVTHPYLWRSDISAEDGGLLWFGWIGDNWTTATAYYTPGALARGMETYNLEMLSFCKERRLECVDAASTLNAEPDILYDDVHFTERGSARLAEVLATWLTARAPY